MSQHKHYILGASLGTGIQPTAVAVLEHEVWKNDKWKPETVALSLRYLERIPLDTGYPDTVQRIDTLLKTAQIKDEECDKASDVVLDVTGSGRAIVELFDRAEIGPIVVTITGAGVREEETESKDWCIPKVELVGNLQVVNQLQAFKNGSRTEPLMLGQAMMLTDEDMRNLAVYFSELTVATKVVADPTTLDYGQRLYRGGSRGNNTPACIACHGPNGRGNPAASYPSLKGQYAVYIAKQLREYASGARKSDGATRVMRDIAAKLSEEDIVAVSSYVQGLQ